MMEKRGYQLWNKATLHTLLLTYMVWFGLVLFNDILSQ